MKTLTFVKEHSGETNTPKPSKFKYRLVDTTFTVCGEGFEHALGLCKQPVGTTIEVNVGGIYRVFEKEQLL